MIKSILYPTDFSDGSRAALPMLADIARKYGAKVYVLHVIYDIAQASGWYVPHASMDEMYKEIDAAAKKEIEKCCLEELRGHEVERVVTKGIPHEQINKFVGEKNIDLIVMGTHGRKGFDRVLFGSTAAKVVKTSACPVLTVRAA